MIRILEDNGFEFEREGKGSHVIYRKGTITVTVPIHGKKDLNSKRNIKTGRVKMLSYPAILTEDKTEGGYTVEFPDLPGCITEGETLDEALSYAREVLTLYLESIDSRKLPIPHPSKRNGKNIHWIEPDKKVGFAIWLKINREEQGLSQTKIANRLGVTQQAYQRFENPRKTNPTLSQIVKLENLFGREILKP